MNKFYNIFSKIVIILALATGWGGSAWAQNPVKNICATFNNPSGNTAWGNVVITPNASDASENINTNVAITVNGTTALKAPVNALTSEFLGPNQQTSTAGVGGTYTFTITGLPVGSSFDKIALPLKAVNSGGSNQGVNTFMVNVAISVTDGTNSLYQTTLNDIRLQNSTSGEVHENISATPATSVVTNTGRLEVSFTITKGTTNPGCYMAFHGLNLTTEIELDPNRFNLQLSDTPSAVDWASNTHWYTIRLASNNGYMSQGADYLDNGYMKSNVTTKPSDDAGKWCFVASGSNNRVYIYNKESGVSKVLSIDNTNNNEKLYMMDKDAATQKAHDWSYVASNSAPGYFFWHYNAGVVERSFTTNSNHFVTAWSGGLGSVTGASNLNKFIIEECVEDYPTFDIDESKYSFEPTAGRVTKRQDFQLKLAVEGKTIVSCTELNDEGTTVPVVMPRLVSMARASIAATSVTKVSDGVYTIHFDGDIDDGNYTLSVPSGVFYVKDGEDVQRLSSMSIDYFLVSPGSDSGYSVIIKQAADDSNLYAVTTTANVNSGRKYAYNGEFLDLAAAPTAQDLMSLTINAPEGKFVWGPAIDAENQTITFEVKPAVTTLTAGKWYQVQILPKGTRYQGTVATSNMVDALNGLTQIARKSQYLYFYQHDTYSNNYPLDIAGYYVGKDMQSYIYVPSVGGSASSITAAFQTVTGRYITYQGLQSTSNAAQSFNLAPQADMSLAWNGGARPWYNLGTPNHLSIGWSGSNQSQCFFTYFTEVDPTELYDVYRVSVSGGTDATTVTYNPAYNGVKQVYNGGYFFLEKNHKPTAADFTVAGGVTITNLAVDIEETGVIKTLILRERQAQMGSTVSVLFKTTDDKVVNNATAYFNAPDGTQHVLTSGNIYDLSAYEYIQSRFSVSDEFRLVSMSYTEATQTLTFVLMEDMTSPEPVDGHWAEGTKWYTLKNVRRNSLVGVTSAHSENNDKIYFIDGAGDASSAANWWCFVPDGENGLVMYNKAFGPDFVLAVNGGYPQMTHKGEIVGKVYHYHLDDHTNPDAFTIYLNASHNGNGSAFNDVSHYFGTWNNTSETNIKGTGNGSDFLIARVENSLVEAAPLYIPYKIVNVTVTGVGAPSNAGASSTVSYRSAKYAGGSYSRKIGSYILVSEDHALASVTAPDVRCNDLRVSTMAMGASSITISTSSTNPTYRTISISGAYDVTTKYIVHRPNGLLWKAKKYKIDGTESYTVGTQTDDYTVVKMNGKDIYLQNTNQVEVTHYLKPGDDPMPIWFTTTSSSSNNHKPVGYARMFNYDNEFDNSAIGRDHNDNRIVAGTFLTQSGTTAFINGYANKGVGNGYGNNFTARFPQGYTGTGYTVAFESSRLTDVGGESYANGDEADGAASYLCDFDSNGDPKEGFTDPNAFPGMINMLEGTIAQRQIFHLLPASVIADKLYEAQGDKFMEEETIMFPTKNTEWTDNGKNFHNVIPLGYNAVDYWGYTDTSKSDMFHLNHRSQNQAAGLRMYATVVEGLNEAGITINPDNQGFTNSLGIFTESTGSEHSRLASRFVTFRYPTGGVIGDGSQEKKAVIEVRLTNGTMTYNVKRFTLVFVPNTDPIPYDEIMGHDDHSRSDVTLEARYGKPYEEMKFKMPAQYNFTLPGSELHDMGHVLPAETGNNNEPAFQPQVTAYYQFPLDFGQMSYNYYGGTRYVDWGEYGLRHFNSNLNIVPVNYLRAKYNMTGLKNKQAEYQTALQNADLSEVERASYKQLLDDATQAVADNQSKMEDEYYNGYFIYCDASEQPGEMAKLLINEKLCPGTQFYVTAWMSNGTDYTAASPNPNSVIFRIKGRRTDTGKFEQIAAYCPGQITISVRTQNRARRNSNVTEKDPAGNNISIRPWQQVAFHFTNTAPSTMYDEFRLEVDNNSRGSAGSDILFDNVRLYVKKPTVEVRDAAPVCGSSLDLVRITTDYDALMEAIKGNTSINTGSTGSGTKAYYGVYAVLDKTEYMKKLGEKQNPTTSDLAEAFMASIVGDTNADNCLYDDDNNAATPEVLDKSRYAFHTIKFFDQFDAHAVVTYSDLINSEEREVAGRFMQGESKSLVFNCKFEDEGLKGGDDYMLVFAIQTDEAHTLISGKSGADYVNYFNLDGDCRIVHEFTPSSATMVRIDGAQGVNPYKIDYCPGSAPNVTLNSYSYDINTGKLVQEIGVEYDWYYGTLKDYREKKIHGSDGVDHTLDEALMNFRIFYPDVNETDLSTCTPQGPTAVNSIDYTLTQSMIDMIKTEVEAGTLKLRKTNALFEIDKVDGDDAAYTVVAIKLGNRVTSKEDEDGTTHYFVYCAEPVELKFYTNHETPAAAVGLADVTYVDNTPYNVRDKKGNLISVPTRINQTQVRELISKSKKTYLRLPIDVMVPSGYYKSDVDDGHGGKIPQTTDMVRFLLDPTNTDVVVAETNDPQWQLYDVSGTEMYMPVVGKLKEISARKQRKLFTWLTGNGKEDSGDLLGIDFSDPTIQRTFIPREGYYYVLRARFLEEADGYDVSEDDPEYDPSLKEQFKFHKSPLFDTSQVMRCPGTILMPLKIVPEYMKWTGRESTDWNNDRNWIRADYSDLVPSEEQNATNVYNGYPANTTETEGTAYNGLPLPTNDQVVRQSDPDKKFEGLDIYIPMEEGVETSGTSSPYSFGYAPTEHTSVIIPTGLTHYPALKAHAKGTDAAQKGLLLLNQDSEEENTSIIEYDMVAVTASGNYLGSSFYEAKPYYENTVKDITFEPGATMYGAEHLNYRKAWVEYSLPTDQWTALASPLQETYAGEWYAPTEGAQQLTPQFQDITYSTALNNRFAPAFYQRSWDKSQAKVYRMPEDGMAAGVADRITESGKIDNVAVSLDWSHVYNDVTVNYSAGGFSVKPVAPDAVGGKTLVRMPKADTSYDYYDQSGSYNGDHTAITRTAGKHNRLFSDLVKNGGSFTQVVENANEEDGMSYFLVANPFMTAMDMDKFFDGNAQFERKFWTPDGKTVSVQSEQGWQSIAADMTGQQVQPLTSFFVRGAGKTATVKYNAQMQATPADGSATATSAMLYMIAEQKGEVKSTAAVACGEGYSAEFSEHEDGQLLIDEAQDENLCRVFTMADGQALQINATNGAKAIPLGILAAEGVETSVTFSGVDAIGTEGEAQLYDAVEQTYVPLTEDTTLSVMGSSLGRYYILTGIQQAEETLDETTGECYDLQGLRINTIRHGQIYIQNHKRILAR